MPKREIALENNYIYHILNRGVANQDIYNSSKDYNRFIYTMLYYQYSNPPLRYSFYIKQGPQRRKEILESFHKQEQMHIKIICYCLMPNHYHILAKQSIKDGISEFIRLTTNSYSKYFNTKFKRSGPLFQGRFKAVKINTDSQLLHVSRYIHLNPYSAGICEDFNDLVKFPYSSLEEYHKEKGGITHRRPILEHFGDSRDYIEFVKNNADYQKTLQGIKKMTLEQH